MTDLSILKVFEPKVRNNIIDFCKDLNETKADIYVVMARKAACLVSALEKLSLLTLHGEVISERVLDCNIEWTSYKSVIIIDDVIISGTTLFQTISKIKSANPSICLDLFVLGVNKDWYNKEVLEYDKGVSYIHTPIRSFDNSECIRLSGDIVRMLAYYPMPYNIDFPIYNTLRLSSSEYNQIMTLPGWNVSEVTSFSHEKDDILTYTFIPQQETLENCGPFYSSNALQHSLLKIRTYCRRRKDKKHEVYLLTIVPMLIMPPVESGALKTVFEALAGSDRGGLLKMLNANTSRLRFVQFVLADLLARRFIQSVNNILCKDNSINRDFGSLRYLFPSSVINSVSKLADEFEGNLFESFPCKEVSSDDTGFEVEELLDVNDILSRPFMEMYYKEEIRSRELVREHGKNVFNNSSYTESINRLKRGISLPELVKRLKGIDEKRSMSFVSAFLDRAIDEGIVVPITVEKDGLVYRAFRHGEDVQFGQQEERLCYDMLSVFVKQIGRTEIPKLWMEKMIVLLFQLGEGEIFTPIQTSLESYDVVNGTTMPNVASVRYYLQGPLVVRPPKDKPFEKQYLEHKDKASWMSTLMVGSSYSPVKLSKSGMFLFDKTKYSKLSDGDNQIVIDGKKSLFAKNIGLLFGALLANNTKKKEPSLNRNDLVMLTSSLETKNVIGALAAEINICHGQFVLENEKGIYNILKAVLNKTINPDYGFEIIRKSAWYQALNDGCRKFIWYVDHTGYATINKITAQFDDELYKATWESLWSPNLEYRGNTEKEKVVDIAVVEGLWLLCAHAYYLMLVCLICQNDNKGAKNEETVSKVKELYSLLNRHANHQRVRDVLPIMADFFQKSSDTQYVAENIPVIFERFVVLFNRCSNLLDSASNYYRNSLKIPKVSFYNHALYFEATSEEGIKLVRFLYENIRFKISKSKEKGNVELLMIHHSDDVLPILSNQCVLISYNENGLFWLLQAAIEANATFRGRCGLKMLLYPSLNPDCHIKVSPETRFECQSYEDLMIGTMDIINALPFSTNTLYVMSEGGKDIRYINQRYKDYYQIYMEEHTFYLPNKRDFKLYKYQTMDGDLQFKADIGIITIVDEEAAAVRTGFGMDPGNPIIKNNRYYDIGKFTVNSKEYNVVHLQCSKQGNTEMAVAALELAKYFNPDRMVLLGIAGAIQDDVKIGDVVIADDVFYYDSRKMKPDGVIDRRLRSFNISNRMNSQIVRYRSIWNQLRNCEDRTSNHLPVLHVAPIGTGEAVIGDKLSDIRSWLLSVHSKTCAVETEAAGFSAAILETMNGTVDYLIIRGISDKADVEKKDEYRRLASENAVLILKDFVEKIVSRS